MSIYINREGELLVGDCKKVTQITGGGETDSSTVVGGAAYATGGWGQHECDCRQERYLASGGAAPGSYGATVYGGRRWVGAADAVESIAAAAWKRRPALRVALGRLAAALGRLEDELCAPDESGAWECFEAGDGAATLTVPPLTSADVRAAAADPLLPASPELLRELDTAVRAAGAAYGLLSGENAAKNASESIISSEVDEMLISSAPVDIGDDSAVFALEARALPRVRALEQVQAALAARADAVARAIESRKRNAIKAPARKRANSQTRKHANRETPQRK
jgi:hypothetical protein